MREFHARIYIAICARFYFQKMSKRLKWNDTVTLTLLSHHFPMDVSRTIEYYILPIDATISPAFQYAKSGHFELCWKEIKEYFPCEKIRTVFSWAIDSTLTMDYASLRMIHGDIFRKLIYMAGCFDNVTMLDWMMQEQICVRGEIIQVAYKLNKWNLIEMIMNRINEYLEYGWRGRPHCEEYYSIPERALMFGCRQNNEQLVELCLDKISVSNPIWAEALGIACLFDYYGVASIICENILQDFHCGKCGVTFDKHGLKRWRR